MLENMRARPLAEDSRPPYWQCSRACAPSTAKSGCRGIRANLDHMLELKTESVSAARKNLLCFSTSFRCRAETPGDCKELERLSIEDGAGDEVICQAKEYGCYIKFGAYVIDKDWPGHVLSVTSIIGPDGSAISRGDWKARNIKGAFPGFNWSPRCRPSW